MNRVALSLLVTTAAMVRPLPTWGQLHLPPTDGRGEVLATPETVLTALHHQQTLIYLLLAFLLLSMAANVWVTVAFVRLQFTVERMAEAIRRVDLLETAFRAAQRQWDHTVEHVQEEASVHDLDLDEDLTRLKGGIRHD